MATTYKWVTKTDSKLEQASKLLKIYCILNNIKPSDTGILVCAFILVYGLSEKSKEDILKTGILGEASSLRNEIYTLRNMGLLEGRGKHTRISSRIVPPGIQPTTPQTLVIINLDNR